jgi:hypothetical protein
MAMNEKQVAMAKVVSCLVFRIVGSWDHDMDSSLFDCVID